MTESETETEIESETKIESETEAETETETRSQYMVSESVTQNQQQQTPSSNIMKVCVHTNSSMNSKQTDESTSSSTDLSESTTTFEHVPFDFDTEPDTTTALVELVTVTATTTVAAAQELRTTGYERTENRCPDTDCNGRLWVDAIGAVCDTCAICIDDESNLDTLNSNQSDSGDAENTHEYCTDPWQRLWNNRPTYHSGIRKCVGGMAHYHWYDSDDLPPSRGLDSLNPRSVYLTD